MSTNHQSNNNHPIGFSSNGKNSTKGGSVRDEGQGTRDKGQEISDKTLVSSPSARPAKPSGVEGSLVLSPFEKRAIACFVEIATGFNLPRSTGEIFGLIYASPEPVPFDGVMQRLNLSKASTSTGLKFLQRLGAVKTVYVGGDRRTFYEPEMSMRQLLTGLMNETLMPHLRNSNGHIEQMRELLPEAGHPGREVLEQRVGQLTHWQGKASRVLPMLMRLGKVKEQ